jgi:molybdopterin molybdotransferase
MPTRPRPKRSELLPVAEARARILAGVKPTKAESVSITQAFGRVLARDVRAKRDQPPFAASAMDGYAVRRNDIARLPATLDIVGQSSAGARYTRTVKPGQAVRIFTGAPVPSGADTIVLQEHTTRTGGQVMIERADPDARYIRPAGLDFSRGDTLITAGTRLNARNLGLAASANAAELQVHRKPEIALLGTGNELVLPGRNPGPDQIVSSNNAALTAAICAFGGQVRDLGIVPDDLTAIRAAIGCARDADVLLTIGGASVGDHDLVQAALKAEGIKLGFWRIAMRPGKPLMFARRGTQRILGLPGNPVSALVCARIFVKPLIDALLGSDEDDTLLEARLTAPLDANDERQDHLRARYERAADGTMTVTAFSRQDSSMQSMLAGANCLIIRSPHAKPARKGSKVNILPLDF